MCHEAARLLDPNMSQEELEGSRLRAGRQLDAGDVTTIGIEGRQRKYFLMPIGESEKNAGRGHGMVGLCEDHHPERFSVSLDAETKLLFL